MAHTIVNGMHCAYMNVDAYNFCGIATADIDNGTILTLGDMKLKDATGGFEFAVTAGGNGEFIAITPEVGYSLEAQIYADPRYFTNKAGKPISVKRLVKGDSIEITVDGFTATPGASDTYATVGVNGKFTSGTTTSAPFKILATHNMDVGSEIVKTWILMKQ
uniref:Uncharacterized protein n=1 Tax=Siphoviridae sp. ctKcB20 TaxID=2827568 RepID=A0A8S5LLK6_9CAUD|nr:MAG TPA: hypothetical protein [Siphoviridae sp. ctKcB20]